MSEDKMREEFRKIHPNSEMQEQFAEGWKACAAIKDAEIVKERQLCTEYIEQRNEAYKEIAARDLMIKELQAQLVDTRATLLGLQPDFGGPIAAQMGKAVLRINEVLANSEHHNSRALEKMLLEARIDELTPYDPEYTRKFQDYEAKLAELNRE